MSFPLISCVHMFTQSYLPNTDNIVPFENTTPFPLSRWKLNNHFSMIQPFLFAKSLLTVDLRLRCHVHMQVDVAHNMYPIPAIYHKIFNQMIHIMH